MHYLSRVVKMNFEEAVDATRQALTRHHLAILAEIDLRNAIRGHLAIDFRPYLVLCACSLPLARQALEADENSGSIVLCNVVIQQRDDRRVEISTVDPDATIGTINHVDLVGTSRELRTVLEHVIDDVELFAKCRHRRYAAAGQEMTHRKAKAKLATKIHLCD
jgi:uncharacterized protein (DUF302 family)